MTLTWNIACSAALLTVASMACAEEQIEVDAVGSGRLYANYTHGDCCTLDAWEWGETTLWTETCETMGGYCMGGKDVANWMFRVPELPEGAEILEVRFTVRRQSGSTGTATMKLRGFSTESLSMSRAQMINSYPTHSQSAYFSSSMLHSFELPVSYFLEPDMEPFLAVALYRSSTLSFYNSGSMAPTLEFTIATGPPCNGDLTDDGVVNGADLSQMLGFWGTASEHHDLDGNGLVDGADLAIVLGEWGDCPDE